MPYKRFLAKKKIASTMSFHLMFRSSIGPLAIHNYPSVSPEVDQGQDKAYNWLSFHILNILNIFSYSLADKRSMA